MFVILTFVPKHIMIGQHLKKKCTPKETKVQQDGGETSIMWEGGREEAKRK